jgi:hypothetical protein
MNGILNRKPLMCGGESIEGFDREAAHQAPLISGHTMSPTIAAATTRIGSGTL